MGFKGSFFQPFTHTWSPGWGDVLLCLQIRIFYQFSIYVSERLCPNHCSCLCKCKFPSSLVSPLKLTSRGGHPYRISKGGNPNPAHSEHLTFKWATGNMSTQDKPVFWHSFARVCLRAQFKSSTLPELWGQ